MNTNRARGPGGGPEGEVMNESKWLTRINTVLLVAVCLMLWLLLNQKHAGRFVSLPGTMWALDTSTGQTCDTTPKDPDKKPKLPYCASLAEGLR
jgi:hypothetical protein